MDLLDETRVRESEPGHLAAVLRRLAESASLEATPAHVRRGDHARFLAPGRRIYLPFLPGADLEASVVAATRLKADGFEPVPHIAARTVDSRDALDDALAELARAGVESLLLIGGDRGQPAGPFSSTLDLLDSGLLLKHGFRRFGIAGHPEGHPGVDDKTRDDALATKWDYARATGSRIWLVTQFVFAAGPTLAWLERTRRRFPRLPVHLGLAGPTRLTTLIAYAAQCGVGAAAGLARRNRRTARLLADWTPDGLLRELAYQGIANRPDGDALFDALHVFPFGGTGRAAGWLAGLGNDNRQSLGGAIDVAHDR